MASSAAGRRWRCGRRGGGAGTIPATSNTGCCDEWPSGRSRWWCTTRRRRASWQRHAPGARVVEIPHLFAACPEPPSEEIAAWRERHGIAPDAFLFGVFGYLRESKRLHTVLRALERARALGATAALLVAGDFVSSDLESRTQAFAGSAARTARAVLFRRPLFPAHGGRGRLRQPEMPFRGRNVRHCHPNDGNRQAGASQRRRRERAFPARHLRPHRPGGCGTADAG